MIWTLILVPISVLGVWLAARHWYGWAISFVSEALWALYALSLHSLSLLIMSGIWAFIHIRNTLVTRRIERATMKAQIIEFYTDRRNPVEVVDWRDYRTRCMPDGTVFFERIEP